MDFHLDTPEEIAKWIEQRKKNYPTKANIARKVIIIFKLLILNLFLKFLFLVIINIFILILSEKARI